MLVCLSFTGAKKYDSKIIYHNWSYIFLIDLFKDLELGRLPGDIVIKKENSSFYFSIVNCIVVSLVISLTLMFLKNN